MQYNSYENGPVIRNLRIDRKLTVDKVSELTGISTSSIKQIEQGGRNLSMKNLYSLMEVYEVDPNSMLIVDELKDLLSIDKRLSKLPQEKREYLKKTFLFMLEAAI